MSHWQVVEKREEKNKEIVEIILGTENFLDKWQRLQFGRNTRLPVWNHQHSEKLIWSQEGLFEWGKTIWNMHRSFQLSCAHECLWIQLSIELMLWESVHLICWWAVISLEILDEQRYKDTFFLVSIIALKKVWLSGRCTATYSSHINFAIMCPSVTESIQNSQTSPEGFQVFKYLDVRCFIIL